MGTNTKTTRDTKAEAEIEKIARCVVQAKKLADAYQKADHINIWKCIDHSIELITLEHLNTGEVNKVWKKAFGLDSDNGENNNMASVTSRLANVGLFFASNSSRTKAIYNKWKNKCGIHSIYITVRELEKKAIKSIAKKEVITKEQLEKDAEEGVANAEEYAGSITKPTRAKANSKEEPKSWTAPILPLDAEIKKNIRLLIKSEPIVFHRMVLGFCDVGLLDEDYKQAALRNIEKLV